MIRDRLCLAAIVALGLALRIAGAQGGLWLDEAWSVELAREAGNPLAIFLSLNHDNNHHLNTLWLQMVGRDATPMLARALAIVTGSAAIWVAGLIGARRGRITGLVTALIFAISPVLVTLGSEARGYAPMSLALLTSVLLVDRMLAGDGRWQVRLGLALSFALGALSQLTMIFGVCAIGGWVFLTLWQRGGFAAALTGTARMLGPALATLAVVLGGLAAAALTNTAGFRFGGYEPFTILLFLHGIIEMLGFAVGIAWNDVWPLVIVAALVVLAPSLGASRTVFYRLAIIAFPLTLALLHWGNVGHPRYYLVAGLALLLMLAEMIGTAIAAGGWKRWVAATVLAVLSVASLIHDADLIYNKRGDPAAAIRVLAARSPEGATVLMERSTGRAMLALAAEQAHYPLTIVYPTCPAARFIFADRFRGESFPPTMTRCGVQYSPIAQLLAHGLSGTHWTLYERRR
jgi:hypothetical protein